MKVYVMTKFKLASSEEFVGVKSTQKKALAELKKIFPYMRGSVENNDLTSDANRTWLLSVKEVELD